MGLLKKLLRSDDLSGRIPRETVERGIREMQHLIDEGVVEIGPYDADVDGDPADLVWVTDKVLPPKDRKLWDAMAAEAEVVRIKPRK